MAGADRGGTDRGGVAGAEPGGASGDGAEIFVSVAERVRRSLEGASAGERLVARTLLASYPTAGLETAARLAERAGVSAPTVVRFVARLGFAGYRAFQQALRDEIEARRASPLTLAQQLGDGVAPDSLRVSAGAIFRQRLDESFAALSDPEVEAVLDLLADPARRIALIGGRFSHILAEYLDLHLRLLRPGTRVLDPRPESLAAFSVDVGRRDVVVVFDYRRYQRDVVEFTRRVHDRGAKVVLFTDPWLSPAAEAADLVIPVRVEAPSPFDSLVPALALVETVVAGVMARLGKEGEERLRQCEEIVGDVTVE
ncbi:MULTISPECIES: MurR/RpiR family transcriptional regulator [Streptosporangium]|uniref:DNA-binding MurR/RpiR family transcriptional regulator n=1 Tax=Streptosporangium brasiliense TaxID=47480 RepID=A0ABT9R8W7_9ACTN|nr:MurR/RpiR family transcriptional regulator [Streptosporangium brasiliense]MDP9865691.1 DNA-binding MurR/RpiR family transcriptional regulator [Streptosporangium brasiliense]